MLYREIIAVCSEIHTKHINTPCGQNVELLHVKPLGFEGLILFCAVTAKVWMNVCTCCWHAVRIMTQATPLGSWCTALLRRVGINTNKKKRFSFICVCLSVRMYQGGSHSTALVKFDIENFYGNMWINSVFSYKRTANRAGTLGGIVDSSTKCFVVRRQCNENLFLGFRCKPRRFSVVHNYM